jgi:hypothetical protein
MRIAIASLLYVQQPGEISRRQCGVVNGAVT